MNPERPHLEPCPFCGNPLKEDWRKYNPHARCVTEGCKGKQLPLLNLDQQDDIDRWNTRGGVLRTGSACESALASCYQAVAQLQAVPDGKDRHEGPFLVANHWCRLKTLPAGTWLYTGPAPDKGAK